MKNDLHLGIDVGKQHSLVCAVVKQTGEMLVESLRMKTDGVEAWRQLLNEWREEYELHIAFEVGAHYDWMYDLCKEYAAEVVVVNASRFGIISQSHKKTDKEDARKLAEGLLRGDLPNVFVPDKQTRADRRLVSFVHYHSQLAGTLKGRLRSLLQTFRVECPKTDILSKASQQWLRETARAQLDADGQLMLDMLLAQAAVVLAQRAQLDRVVKERVQRYPDAPLVQSVPGFGSLTSLAVLCVVVAIGRFATPEKLAGYLGTCGGIRQSGQTKILTGMTKAGNAHVRWLLAQALLHLFRKDPKARARYLRLKRRKRCGVARGAMMRWLTVILWQVWTKREAYRIGGKRETDK